MGHESLKSYWVLLIFIFGCVEEFKCQQLQLGNLLNSTLGNQFVAGGNNAIYDHKPADEIRRGLPIHVLGFDKDGRIVFLFDIGKWNLSTSIRRWEGKWDQVFKYLEQNAQFWTDLSLAPEMNPNGTVRGPQGTGAIIDCKGTGNIFAPGLVQFYTEIAGLVLRTVETVSYGIFINMNPRQLYFYNYIIRPTLPAISKRTFTFGFEPEKFIPVLQKRIPRDQLPEYLGGFKNFTYIAKLGQRFNYNLKIN